MQDKAHDATEKTRTRPIDVLIAILVLGSLWGLIEVVAGGAIKDAGLPHRVAIVTGLGIGVMGIAVAMFRRPLMLLGIALVAILCKQLVVPILHVSIFCKANSCLAVLLEGGTLAGIVYIARGALKRPGDTRSQSGITASTWGVLAVVGASAALVAAGAFHYIGMKLAPCNHLMSYNRAGGFVEFMTLRATVWAVFSAILFPLGYWTGLRLRESAFAFGVRRPVLYYTASAACVAACWLGSAFAILAGF